MVVACRTGSIKSIILGWQIPSVRVVHALPCYRSLPSLIFAACERGVFLSLSAHKEAFLLTMLTQLRKHHSPLYDGSPGSSDLALALC